MGNQSPNKHKIILISVIIIGISGISIGLGYYFYYNPIFNEEREPNKFFWVRWSDSADDVLSQYSDKIDMISPNWYVLESDGSLNYSGDWKSASITDHNNVLSICNTKGITVHPMITKGTEENMRALMENSNNQIKFFENLTQLIAQYDFDGFNLDFEGVSADLRDEFNLFFADMKQNITEEKMISIAVPAKTRDDITGWAGWCDYETIGELTDMFMIMTYDEHGGWTGPGEVTSFSWLQKVLAYATRAVPLEKIYAGIPRYGYDWAEEDENWENWGYGYSFFEDKYSTYGGTKTRSTDGYEVILEYTDGNGYDHICYYADWETTLAKEEFLSKYPIGGYCYWYLTSGDPEYFNKI